MPNGLTVKSTGLPAGGLAPDRTAVFIATSKLLSAWPRPVSRLSEPTRTRRLVLLQLESVPQLRVTSARALPAVVRTPWPPVTVTDPDVWSTWKVVTPEAPATTLPRASGLTEDTEGPVVSARALVVAANPTAIAPPAHKTLRTNAIARPLCRNYAKRLSFRG